MNDIFQILGLAYKARKLVSGPEVLDVIRSKKAYLVIVASDASANTKKKIINKAKYYQIPYYEMLSVAQISHSIGKNNRVAIAIIDEGFSKLIMNKIKEE